MNFSRSKLWNRRFSLSQALGSICLSGSSKVLKMENVPKISGLLMSYKIHSELQNIFSPSLRTLYFSYIWISVLWGVNLKLVVMAKSWPIAPGSFSEEDERYFVIGLLLSPNQSHQHVFHALNKNQNQGNSLEEHLILIFYFSHLRNISIKH